MWFAMWHTVPESKVKQCAPGGGGGTGRAAAPREATEALGAIHRQRKLYGSKQCPNLQASSSGLRRRLTPRSVRKTKVPFAADPLPRCRVSGASTAELANDLASPSQPVDQSPCEFRTPREARTPSDTRSFQERTNRGSANSDAVNRRISRRELRMERRLRRRAETMNMVLTVFALSVCVVGITAFSVALAVRR